jgi:hypothetical protein
MKWIALLMFSSLAWADATVAPAADGVSCKTIDDCWLGPGGVAIKRPKKYRGKEFPRGDCGANHHWLANRLSCEDNLCKVTHVGDTCELPSKTLIAFADELVDFGFALDAARPGVCAEQTAR